MINYETILSLFDDKLTLLQYLTKIEEALKNEQLTDITVTQTDASHVYFTFVFEDGSTIDTPTFTLPAGPQGIQGPQGEQGIQGEQGEQGPAGADGIDGISVTGAEINVNNHLILTLSNSNTIDAGLVSSFKVINIGTFNYVTPTFAGASLGTYTPTQSELNAIFNDNYYCLLKFTLQISESVSEVHYLYKIVNDPATSTIIYYSIMYALNLQTNQYFISIDNTVSAKTLGIKIPAIMARNVYAQGATAGQVLTADGSNGASWQTASGGADLYEHHIDMRYSLNSRKKHFIFFTLVTNDSTAFTYSTIITYISSKLANSYIDAAGWFETAQGSGLYNLIEGIGYFSSTLQANIINPTTQALGAENIGTTGVSVSDKVIKIT